MCGRRMEGGNGNLPFSGQRYQKLRQIYCEDAVIWLESSIEEFNGSVFCGIPDIADIYGFIPSEELIQRGNDYKEWFIRIVRLIFRRLSERQCIIFTQTDGKIIDEKGHMVWWLDKSHLCSLIANEYNCQLLWHKIAIDPEAGISSHRPCYTHVLCYGKSFTYHTSEFMTPDVIDRGVMTWEKATGLDVCLIGVSFLKYIVKAPCVINPFCGQGTISAVSDCFQIPSIGIEIMPKRARKAQCKDIRSRISAIPKDRLRLLLGDYISRELGLINESKSDDVVQNDAYFVPCGGITPQDGADY